MAERLAKISEIGEYLPYPFTASQASTLIDTSHTHGSFLGLVTVNTLGSSLVITLLNGATPFAVITPTSPGSFHYNCVVDSGLHVQLAGSGFNITITADGMAV